MSRIALAFVAVLAAAHSAIAVVLCARPRPDGTFSANVKIRELCTSRETVLNPSVLGLQGPKGDPGTCGCSTTTSTVSTTTTTLVGTCSFRGTPCTSDADCRILGICNPYGAPECFQTCSTNADCRQGMTCFTSMELGSACAGCSGNDALCPSNAQCNGNDCMQSNHPECTPSPRSPCTISDPCLFTQ